MHELTDMYYRKSTVAFFVLRTKTNIYPSSKIITLYLHIYYFRKSVMFDYLNY